MKKSLKRTLAIVMAVAMLFALSVTAFAYDNQGIVTVTIKYDGVAWKQITVTAAEISAYLPANASHLYTQPSGTDITVFFSSTFTAADALIAAYHKDVGVNYNPNSFDYTWYDVYDSTTYQPVTIDGDQVQGLYFTKFWGDPSDDGDYHLTAYDTTTGLYTYYWEGYSWSFSINGQGYADYYSSDYALNGTSPVVTSIEMDYMYINTGYFTSTTFIPGAIDERP